MRFKIGDSVISKLGPLCSGEIVAIYSGTYYWETVTSKVFLGSDLFDTLYPGWTDGVVYVIEYAKPQKPFNPERLRDYFKERTPEASDEMIDKCLKISNTNLVKFNIAPEADLESISALYS